MKLITRRSLRRLAVLFALIFLGMFIAHRVMFVMPGESHRGPLPELTESQRELAAELERDVTALAAEIGSRSIFFQRKLVEAAAYLRAELEKTGFAPEMIAEYPVERGSASPSFEATQSGTTHASEIIVVGAHYDAFQGTPGADDNASGCAAVLALARRFAPPHAPQARTIRFVLFTNEEPPNFMQPTMGSLVYAKACRTQNDTIVAMLSLETLGYYSSEPGSQEYPPGLSLLFPSTGDFVAFVGNISSRSLLRDTIGTFRAHTFFPSEGAAMPEGIPGVGWSDQWAFWQVGYPGIMITDTAMFRNPHYHQPTDTPDTLNYDHLARIVEGLEAVITKLANPSP